MTTGRSAAIVGIILFGAIATVTFLRANRIDLTQGPTAEWPAYGNDDGGTRYSVLDQINRENVSLLEVAWEYHTGDSSDGSDDLQPTTFPSYSYPG